MCIWWNFSFEGKYELGLLPFLGWAHFVPVSFPGFFERFSVFEEGEQVRTATNSFPIHSLISHVIRSLHTTQHNKLYRTLLYSIVLYTVYVSTLAANRNSHVNYKVLGPQAVAWH